MCTKSFTARHTVLVMSTLQFRGCRCGCGAAQHEHGSLRQERTCTATLVAVVAPAHARMFFGGHSPPTSLRQAIDQMLVHVGRTRGHDTVRVLHGESSKRLQLAPPRNTKDKKHLQSTQSAQPTNLTDQAPSTTERTARETHDTVYSPRRRHQSPRHFIGRSCMHAVDGSSI